MHISTTDLIRLAESAETALLLCRIARELTCLSESERHLLHDLRTISHGAMARIADDKGNDAS